MIESFNYLFSNLSIIFYILLGLFIWLFILYCLMYLFTYLFDIEHFGGPYKGKLREVFMHIVMFCHLYLCERKLKYSFNVTRA